MKRTLLGVGGALVLTVQAAAASPFVTLPRADGDGDVGVDLALTPKIDFVLSEASAVRLEPYGEYAVSDQLVVYGSLPITHASSDADSQTALGGLELGAGYVVPTSRPGLRVMATAALVLPTAPDGDAAAANALAGYGRVVDVLDWLPKIVGPRLGGTAIYRSGKLTAQGSLGVEGAYYTGDNISRDDVGPLLHLAAGLAYDAGALTLGGELVSVLNTEDDSDDTLSTLALTGRIPAGSATAYAAVVFPLESDVRDVVPVVFTLGAEFPLTAR